MSMSLREAGRIGFISSMNSLGPPVLCVQHTTRGHHGGSAKEKIVVLGRVFLQEAKV